MNALIAFARAADSEGMARDLDEELRAPLVASGLFEPVGEEIALRADLLVDLPALRWRSERFAAALEAAATIPRQEGESEAALREIVAFAAVLFDHELFFEVHEVLEPPWQRATGELRNLLQGLIQVAVGFHHHANANPRGALSLLAEGNAKLFAHVPEAYGIDLATFCRDVEQFATALRHELAGDPPADAPGYPPMARAHDGNGG